MGRVNFSVEEIEIGDNGMLWVGTFDGVFSFDGYEAEPYQESLLDTARDYFQGDVVSSLILDSDKNVWASTYNRSINLKPAGDNKFINLNKKLNWFKLNPVMMIESHDGYVWTISQNEVLRLKYNQENGDLDFKYRDFGKREELLFWSIFQSEKGTIYVLGNGLFEVSYSEISGIELKKVLEGKNYRALLENEDGSFLLGIGADLYHWNAGEMPVLILERFTGGRWINNLYKDQKGFIWVSTGNGIFRLSLNANFTLQNHQFFETGVTHDVKEDGSGNIFIASDLGLLKLSWDYDQYSYVKFPDEYENLYSYKYFTDINGNYWIGTQQNLLVHNVSDKRTVKIPSSAQIFSIVEDSDYNIWTGSREGLKKYNPHTLKNIYYNRIGFTHNLVKHTDGKIWGLNKDSLFRLNPENDNIEFIEPVSGLDNQRFMKFLISDQNKLWLFNSNWELIKFDISEGELKFEQIYSLDEARYQINWMVDDDLGNLWLSTKKGVLIFNKKSGFVTKLLNNENTFPDNDTFELIKDNSGTIWVKQANYGSTAIDPVTLETLTFTPAWLTRPYDSSYYCVTAIGRNGELFTDGRGGFFVFHPDSISNNNVPPKVFLKNVLVNNQETTPSKLKHNQNDIEFRYTGTQFDDPERNNFAFFLDGYDDSWKYVEVQRTARYLSLPPGDYSFYVKASNSEGVWSDETELASFTIFPPWWQTNIAYLIYLLLLSGFGFIVYKTQLNRRLAIAEAKRLQELDKFKTRFFTNISHEFRTPLTVISGLSDRINDRNGNLIKRNAQKVLGLINQILELSKLESSNTQLVLRQGDILAYTNYLLQSVSSYADEQNISISIDSDFEELVMDFDKDKYDLILQNLISNAIKFTPEGGAINLFLTQENNELIIQISDTGIGIMEEDQKRIFDRFYQAETTYSNHQGSGIGLSLTKELVRLMKGNITVESTLGEGTTFIITLPVTNTAEKISYDHLNTDSTVMVDTVEHVDLEQSEPDITSEKTLVLVVEDNKDIRDFVAMVIKEEYEVVTASDGNEGIEKAKKLIPDIIVSDVMMPGKDGIELTRLIKKDKATSHIPVILLTAKAAVESRLTGLKTGADVYLAKPFNETELKTHIHNLIRLRNSIRQKYAGDINVHELGDSLEDKFVKRVHEVIMEHLDEEKFSIDDLCRSVGISRTQLHRKLKALTDKSTSIFIRDIRLSEARKLLRSTTDNVAEIAYQVGFGDPNYFSKLYSDKYDHSPSKERESSN